MNQLNLSYFLKITLPLFCLLPGQLFAQGGNLFDDGVLHEIRFTLVDTNSFIQNRDYQMVDMTIDGTTLTDVGFRKKGNISASHPNNKVPFKIKTNRYVDGQLYDGIREFTLHNNFQDPSMLREKLTYDLLEELDLYSLQTAFAKVYINDQYWGLYTLVEAKDELYRRAFGDDDGSVLESLDFGTMCYEGPNQQDYYDDLFGNYLYILDNGEEAIAWEHFPSMLNVANNTAIDEYVEVVSEQFNIIDFTKYQAANVFLLNFDSYIAFLGNQLYYYQESTGIWQVIPWDFNASFGLWNTNQNSPSDYPILPSSITNGCIAEHIPNVPELRATYLNTLCDLLNDHSSPDALEERIDHWSDQIQEAVLTDNRKAFDNPTFSTALGDTYFSLPWEGNVPGLTAFARDRAEKVQADLISIGHECTITSTTNIPQDEIQISLYPNPSTDFLKVAVSPLLTIEHSQMIDSKGRLIQLWDGYPTDANVSTLKPGIYFIKFFTSSGVCETLRFVKQ